MAGAMTFAISVLSPAPPPTVSVLAAARDLSGGSTLRAEDVRSVAVLPGTVPAGAMRDMSRVIGRVMAGPARAGEVITDVRLVGPSLLDGYGGKLVATPVRIADAEAARLVRTGDAIDVLAAAPAADAGTAEARLVAAGVRVVVVPADDEGALSDGSFGEGAMIVVATTPETAARLASAAVTSRLSLTIRAE
jgi:Flp pilus assembly protein CpaB